MMYQPIGSVAIVGGGMAGSMTAAALSHALERRVVITVIDAGIRAPAAGFACAAPSLHQFHARLGIDHGDFVRATGAAANAGTAFCDWGKLGTSYLRAYGQAHGVQFDTRRYIQYLRRYAQAHGVRHASGPVLSIVRRAGDGRIDAVRLASGALLKADLFIDCSGAAAQLIGKAQGVGIDDWRHWLPCDRAWEVVADSGLPRSTQVHARKAGWQWQTGAQGRTSHGHVFSSAFLGEDEGASLLPRASGDAPVLRRYANGVRRQQWRDNVVAIGAAAVCLEPLEGTGLHLVQSSIARLLAFFPDQAFPAIDIAEFNRQCAAELEQIRDFLILHYHASARVDTPFWQYCQLMEVPERLIDAMELFRSRGRIVCDGNGLFDEHAWRQVMRGQGLRPEATAADVAPHRHIRQKIC
jgi:tryptophan halogenase